MSHHVAVQMPLNGRGVRFCWITLRANSKLLVAMHRYCPDWNFIPIVDDSLPDGVIYNGIGVEVE